ncbi:MAG: hypothetical protein HGA42_09250 [Nostocales cyanobacterium W4_Combined_metabat2_030]|nr:hypothetical protein [Nostocales cyanobacterium W4_Combined_metabat2_030]
MKILFVYSDISGAERYGAKKYYSGIGSLSAVLRAAGHDTALVYLQSEQTREAFLGQVRAAAPGHTVRVNGSGTETSTVAALRDVHTYFHWSNTIDSYFCLTREFCLCDNCTDCNGISC